MAKKISIPYLAAHFAALAILFMWNSNLHALSDSLRILTDTSYFRSGDDNWNLVESVVRDQPSNVLFLLERGANPDAAVEGGMTALTYAAGTGDTLLIKILVLNGANMELSTPEETTPLIVATLNQRFDAAHLLLKKGANPDHQDRYGGTPLIYAAALNDFAMADLLLFFGASDTLKDKNGNDAMMTAVSLGNLECADVLLQNGVRPDSRDKKLNTPLMVAAQYGDIDMIYLLLEYKAGTELVNSSNFTPLAHAIRAGEMKAARILVESDANVNHFISKYQNLYDLAMKQENKEFLKLLESRGASRSPHPDFSEFGLGVGNSFRSGEYIMQGRVWWQDRKFGFFAETGIDTRLITQKIQVEINDTLIHQYRENRTAWTLGAGKYFTLVTDASGLEYGFYGAIYGMLSFPKYKGISERQPPSYNLMPSAGLFLRGRLAGMKAGAERYTFGTLNEGPWKINITLFIRILYKSNAYEYKEIRYES
ncbi:MAG: ankyrin repeat domain-containing protein [Bacteroidales bacterium]